MDLGKVLAELRAELENLNAAILSLEKLQQVSPRKRRLTPGDVLREDRQPGKSASSRLRARASKAQ